MVDKKVVEYVADLARIKVSEEEKEFLSGQLSKILDYIDKLKELNVENIEPLRSLHLESNIFRNDQARTFTFSEDILKNAPLREGNYFKIPKVIE
jgi:aspartyl-tRNA(Asn)/glutamyl-tRNA(Gln) amidotransferase subunit C